MRVFPSTFRAAEDSSRDVLLELDGPCTHRNARLSSSHAESRSFEESSIVRLGQEQLLLFLPNQSLTWLEVECGAAQPAENR
ncbi:MAG: hypothetical protein P8R42_10485 [Candidatus Binatia bacterium]|nr:hypothetical protein [Candidatus Binatia bacterium]